MLKKQYLKDKPVCKVTFTISKEATEGASDVRLLGDFNNWNIKEAISMKAGKGGFSTVVELETGRSYEFRYIADGSRWLNDWQADDYVPSPFHGIDNSVVHIEAVAAKAPAPKAKAAAPAAKKATAKKAVAKKPAEKKVVEKKAVEKKAAAPKKAAKDDLKKIEGVGPKIEKLLNAKGINTFDELAKAKSAVVQGILDEAGPRFRIHDPATWAKQAKMAAKGDWDALNKLQDELKGGRAK